MTARGEGVYLRTKAITTDTVDGNAKTRPGWAGRPGRRAGKRPQRMAKRLTFTEGRLSFDYVECRAFTFGEGTPRPEGQVFRQPRGGPMEAALNFCSFSFKRKGREKSMPQA